MNCSSTILTIFLGAAPRLREFEPVPSFLWCQRSGRFAFFLIGNTMWRPCESESPIRAVTPRIVTSNSRSTIRLLGTVIAVAGLARLYLEAADSPHLKPAYLSLNQILAILVVAAVLPFAGIALGCAVQVSRPINVLLATVFGAMGAGILSPYAGACYGCLIGALSCYTVPPTPDCASKTSRRPFL
jgi:hypothetical protein